MKPIIEDTTRYVLEALPLNGFWDELGEFKSYIEADAAAKKAWIVNFDDLKGLRIKIVQIVSARTKDD